jgi:hypothetical protein
MTSNPFRFAIPFHILLPRQYISVLLSSALAGAVITGKAKAEPFEVPGAAAGFCSFFPEEKGIGLHGYEWDNYSFNTNHLSIQIIHKHSQI